MHIIAILKSLLFIFPSNTLLSPFPNTPFLSQREKRREWRVGE
jgi:hypothetical protein